MANYAMKYCNKLKKFSLYSTKQAQLILTVSISIELYVHKQKM